MKSTVATICTAAALTLSFNTAKNDTPPQSPEEIVESARAICTLVDEQESLGQIKIMGRVATDPNSDYQDANIRAIKTIAAKCEAKNNAPINSL